MQMVLKNQLESADQLSLFLKELGIKHNVPKNVISEIDLALGELILNIIKYAYKEKQNSSIHLECNIKDNKITFILIDDGAAFNPLEYKVQDEDIPLENKTIGGLGIMIVKKFMDFITYERKDNKNQLTLIKLVKK